MFDQSATVVNTQRTHEDDSSELPVLLDFKSVIFVMEDVDAASKVVQRRAAKSVYQPGNKTITTTTVTRAPSTRPGAPSEDAPPPMLRPQKSNSGKRPLVPMLLPQRSHSAK